MQIADAEACLARLDNHPQPLDQVFPVVSIGVRRLA